eukprot:403352508
MSKTVSPEHINQSQISLLPSSLDDISFEEADIERLEKQRLFEELQHSNKLVMQLRERLFQKEELMNNENAIFELSRLKYKFNVLPVPLFAKSAKIVMRSLKQLSVYKQRESTYLKVKNVFKSHLSRIKKIFIYLFWIYMGEKFPIIEIPKSLLEKFRSHLNKHYMEFYMAINKLSLKLKDLIVNILPFHMGEAVKLAMDIRIKNGKNLLNMGEQIQLYAVMYRELLGISCSSEYIYQQKDKILSANLTKPNALSQNQNTSLMAVQSQHLKRQLFARKLVSLLPQNTKVNMHQNEVENLSQDIMHIFERDNEPKKNQSYAQGGIGNRTMKNQSIAVKPPLYKKNIQLDFKENQADIDLKFYQSTMSLSQSETRIQNQSTFNVFQCSPMFQKSSKLLLQDSPVNKSHQIKHVVNDHSERQQSLSKLLFKKYQSEKRLETQQPRKVAMRGMSILHQLHQQNNLKLIGGRQSPSEIQHNQTMPLLMNANSTPLNFMRSKESIENTNNQMLMQLQLEKERPRFFVIEKELNKDGTYHKKSKIRQNLKRTQALSNTRPPASLTTQLLNSSRGSRKEQHSVDFYNPKVNNLAIDHDIKIKTSKTNQQDLEFKQEQLKQELQSKGERLLQSLDDVKSSFIDKLGEQFKKKIENKQLAINDDYKENKMEMNNLKGELLFLNDKRDLKKSKEKVQKIIKLRKIIRKN